MTDRLYHPRLVDDWHPRSIKLLAMLRRSRFLAVRCPSPFGDSAGVLAGHPAVSTHVVAGIIHLRWAAPKLRRVA